MNCAFDFSAILIAIAITIGLNRSDFSKICLMDDSASPVFHEISSTDPAGKDLLSFFSSIFVNLFCITLKWDFICRLFVCNLS